MESNPNKILFKKRKFCVYGIKIIAKYSKTYNFVLKNNFIRKR